jgi:hypothetical protein
MVIQDSIPSAAWMSLVGQKLTFRCAHLLAMRLAVVRSTPQLVSVENFVQLSNVIFNRPRDPVPLELHRLARGLRFHPVVTLLGGPQLQNVLGQVVLKLEVIKHLCGFDYTFTAKAQEGWCSSEASGELTSVLKVDVVAVYVLKKPELLQFVHKRREGAK